MNQLRSHNNGFGLVEIIIVTAIITVAMAAMLQTGTVAVRLLRAEKQNLEAALLAHEGLEAVRSMRDESWTANIAPLSNGAAYYPAIENSKWKLATTDPGVINGKYTRTILFDPVLRDGLDRISASGALDTGTRKITSRVSWGSPAKSVETIMYITNFLEALGGGAESKSVFFETGAADSNLANFPSNNAGDGDPVQTFTTGGSAINVSRIDVLVRRVTALPSDVFVELRDTPTGTALGTSHIITSSTMTTATPVWVEFRFQIPVPLATSTNYALRLHSLPSSTDTGSGSAGLIHWAYELNTPSPYAGGTAYRYVGRLSNPLDPGETLTDYDYSFRVWAVQ